MAINNVHQITAWKNEGTGIFNRVRNSWGGHGHESCPHKVEVWEGDVKKQASLYAHNWETILQVYLPCVLLAKKRYVGFKYENIDEMEPGFDAKGIETVRRDGVLAQRKLVETCLK